MCVCVCVCTCMKTETRNASLTYHYIFFSRVRCKNNLHTHGHSHTHTLPPSLTHIHRLVHTFSLSQPYSPPTHLCQLTSKQCLSVIAPGQTNTIHRGRSRETIDSQLIYQRFALQVLRRKEDKGEGERKG